MQKKFPEFKYLAVVLKYFLRQHRLNEVYAGGLGSYALNLLIISHLQMHTSRFDEEEKNLTSLSSLLIDFLALYGTAFNYFVVAVDTKNERYCRKTDGDGEFSLQVIDPNDPKNNVSKGSSRGIPILRSAFQNAFGQLVGQNPKKRETILSRIISPTKDLYSRAVFIHGISSFTPYIK